MMHAVVLALFFFMLSSFSRAFSTSSVAALRSSRSSSFAATTTTEAFSIGRHYIPNRSSNRAAFHMASSAPEEQRKAGVASPEELKAFVEKAG